MGPNRSGNDASSSNLWADVSHEVSVEHLDDYAAMSEWTNAPAADALCDLPGSNAPDCTKRHRSNL